MCLLVFSGLFESALVGLVADCSGSGTPLLAFQDSHLVRLVVQGLAMIYRTPLSVCYLSR